MRQLLPALSRPGIRKRLFFASLVAMLAPPLAGFAQNSATKSTATAISFTTKGKDNDWVLTGAGYDPNNNITVNGNPCASVQLNFPIVQNGDKGRSGTLRINGLSFASPADIPAGATITGVKVDITRRKSGTGQVRDFQVLLRVGNNSFSPANRAALSDWPGTYATASYGGPTDLWGLGSLAISTVTNANFGVAIQVQRSSNATVTAEIDGVVLTVYYNLGSWYDRTGQGANLHLLSSWTSDPNGGTGASPSSFATGGQNFIVKNNAAATIGGALAISGTLSKLIIGNSSAAITFTIPAAFAYTGVVDVTNNATLDIQNTSLPTLGALATGLYNTDALTGDFILPATLVAGNQNIPSTVIYSATTNQDVASANYGQLFLSGTGTTKTLLAGSAGISQAADSLQVGAGVTLNLQLNELRLAKGLSNNGTITGDVGATNGLVRQVGAFDAYVSGTGSIRFFTSDNITNSDGITLWPALTFNAGAGQTFTGQALLNAGAIKNNSGFVPGAGLLIRMTDSRMLDNLSSSNAYDVLYVGDTVSTGGETAAAGLRHLTVNLNSTGTPTPALSFDRNLSLTGDFTITQGVVNANNFSLTLGGNFTNNGSFTATNATVIVNGSGAQNLGGSAVTSFTNLTLNNSGNLANSITVSGQLNLGGGSITLNNFDLTLSGASASVTGTGTTRYVKTNGTGQLVRNIANGGSFLFPVGNSSYNPVTISNGTTAADNFKVRVIDELLNGGATGIPMNNYNRVQRSWVIDKTILPNGNSGTGIDFLFRWDPNNDVTSTAMVSPGLYHFSTGWVRQTGTTTVDQLNGTLTYSGYKGNFSPFGIVDGALVLPIRDLKFAASKSNGKAILNWSTGAETDTRHFAVEHSADGQNWEVLGTVPAAGNSQQTRHYQFIHAQPSAGTNFYRLQQADLNGRTTASPVAMLRFDAGMGLVVFPNPAQRELRISLQESSPASLLRITDLSGRQLWAQALKTGNPGMITVNIAAWQPGLYVVEAMAADGTLHQRRFIKQ